MPTTADSLYRAYRRLSQRERVKFLQHLREPDQVETDVIAFSATGEPLTKTGYIAEINKAIAAIERGDVFTDDEVTRELEAEY